LISVASRDKGSGGVIGEHLTNGIGGADNLVVFVRGSDSIKSSAFLLLGCLGVVFPGVTSSNGGSSGDFAEDITNSGSSSRWVWDSAGGNSTISVGEDVAVVSLSTSGNGCVAVQGIVWIAILNKDTSRGILYPVVGATVG
jgi:hypothetical protein